MVLSGYSGLFMVFNATFNNISVNYRGDQFYWCRKLKYPAKTTDLPQVADNINLNLNLNLLIIFKGPGG
jgi:hypothetical protein